MLSEGAPIDWDWLAGYIAKLIRQAGANSLVLPSDLRVRNIRADLPPQHVTEAMMYGTKFFDAAIYFALAIQDRPRVSQGERVRIGPEQMKKETCTHLLWVALFLMIRGHYPSAEGTAVGRNIPKFLRANCMMNVSPAQLATHG